MHDLLACNNNNIIKIFKDNIFRYNLILPARINNYLFNQRKNRGIISVCILKGLAAYLDKSF